MAASLWHRGRWLHAAVPQAKGIAPCGIVIGVWTFFGGQAVVAPLTTVNRTTVLGKAMEGHSSERRSECGS